MSALDRLINAAEWQGASDSPESRAAENEARAELLAGLPETCPDFADGTTPAAGFDEGYDAGWTAAIDAVREYLGA